MIKTMINITTVTLILIKTIRKKIKLMISLKN
jgi:hypothetical protein